MKRPLARYIVGLIVMLSLVACGAAEQLATQLNSMATASTTTQTDTSPPLATSTAATETTAIGSLKLASTDPILTIRTSGGHCRYGLCWSEKQIRADGAYHTADGTGAEKNGTFEEAQIAELTQLIAATDFEELASRPFTGTCPTAYDGQEFIYTFHTMSGENMIASCKVAIDESSPLFKHITTLVDVMGQQ